MINDYNALKIHELNIEGFVNTLHKKGVRTTTSAVLPLHEKQLEIVNDKSRFKVIVAGRRFGKTAFCVFVACAVALQPNRRIWVVSDTYQLAEKVFRELYRIIVQELKLVVPGKFGKASTRDYYIELPNGSRIEAKSCENRNSLVGESLDLIVWDEVSLTPTSLEIWEQELNPCLVDRRGSLIMIGTPRGKNNLHYRAYMWGKSTDKRLKDWNSFHFSSYDNPYIPHEEIDKASATMSETRFKQEFLADFEAVTDTCFPEWDDTVHFIDYEYDPRNGPVYVAMDFNFATPCTTLYAQINYNGDIYVFDEFIKKGATVHDQAKQLLMRDEELQHNVEAVIADVAGKQRDPYRGRSAWDDLNDWGIFPKARKQNIETGMDLIRLWLRYPHFDKYDNPVLDENGNQKRIPKLYVSKDAPNTAFAIGSARFKYNRQTGTHSEAYVKDGIVDGPLDALRYMLVYLLHDNNAYLQISAGF